MIIIFFDRKDIQFTAGYHRVKSCIVTKFFDFVFGVSDFVLFLFLSHSETKRFYFLSNM